MSKINHPPHYGGKDNPYEAIKVIKAWGVGFSLGNVLKYIARAEHKGAKLEDLKKALQYLQYEISNLEELNETTDQETRRESSYPKADEHWSCRPRFNGDID